MDTLISIGTLAAFAWSLYALFFGHAGMPGMRHGFELTASASDAASNIYLEVAAGGPRSCSPAGTPRNARSVAGRLPRCAR